VSAQDSNLSRPVRYRKPKADIYTLLLAIALVALIIACVFAYLEIKDYGDQPFSGAPSAALPIDRPTTLAMIVLPEIGAATASIDLAETMHG
jgi:hypothetical protein